MINNFYNKLHYNKYLLWRKYAEKINSYFDLGYFIYNEDMELIKDKFEFHDNGEILLPISSGSRTCYIGDVSDEDGKIYIEVNNKEIKEFFKKWKIVNPKHIRSLK